MANREIELLIYISYNYIINYTIYFRKDIPDFIYKIFYYFKIPLPNLPLINNYRERKVKRYEPNKVICFFSPIVIEHSNIDYLFL